ncbi:chloride channel protein [Sphaerochaeta sp. PS]|uniref:chloride channel protein n=1 Tax=Sphaerochaeta sp. PS TaxID=3076336 RepID=UPI0028A43418|nr:chloride channel protein [Sphaerochaeta sp. PS]MDT4762839.1 chloride channel protein [Sphaerochaeta sp. PS]
MSPLLRKNQSHTFLWLLRSLLLGLIVGAVISALTLAVEGATAIREKHQFLLFFIPVGAALTTFLYTKIGPYLKDAGNQVIQMINLGIIDIAHPSAIGFKQDAQSNYSKISTKMAPLLFLNTFITHLVGASGGKEGVGVQIGASLGSNLGRLEHFLFSRKNPSLDLKQQGIWLISGAGAAFGALFNAPVAGTLFGMQFSSPRENRTDALLPCLVSSLSACLITQALDVHVFHPLAVEAFPLDLQTILTLSCMAIVFGLFSRIFCLVVNWTKQLFSNIKKSPLLRVAIASLCLLVASLLIYWVTGAFTYNGLSIDLIIQAQLGETSLAAPFLKLLLTALTLASGFVGGEVIPLLVIGATSGSLLATFTTIPVSAMAMFGAIGMLSGSTKLPLACFVLGLELFGYANPLSLFLVASLSYGASGKLGIYEKQILPEGVDWV